MPTLCNFCFSLSKSVVIVSICLCCSCLSRAEISGRRPLQHAELARFERPARLVLFGRRDSFGDIESLDLSRDWLSQNVRMVVTVVTAFTVCAKGSGWHGSMLPFMAWNVLGVGIVSSGGTFSSPCKGFAPLPVKVAAEAAAATAAAGPVEAVRIPLLPQLLPPAK